MQRRTFSSLFVVSMRIALFALMVCATAFAQAGYDVVIHGGRVPDPETSLDAGRDVGVRGNQNAALNQRPLVGTRGILAAVLVVAAGFIDLQHHDPTAA